ncbi:MULTISPECIES: ParA family protein [Psychrilyobacter]|uniref:ParA family protein n=1 Tax=Psychrilyobacter piezotolerans TaxID=2293438 RepID=A0ABX9KJ77_9FUSO|nr:MULTISPECIES: ParA family protein [Psychrilyobacter]MCS5421889.1 ParA family protein [Psychrilyobacter sp. S5]NDI76956.1 ParA family protein [Psychrilyobacter piezotolerans]RDE64578.1 ParA family protein [Psychrilyobacter sp. S5]REI42390.1 ParA family protein [Psychrilyobacter piezotolerans]
MAKVILFKNNKGGVGKSLLCFWTGHILSTLSKSKDEKNKVLILTSDSQNNIMQMAGAKSGYGDGLQGYIDGRGSDLIRLREGLFYVPLTSTGIKRTFETRFLDVIEIFKTQYDYILIDGSPVLKLDNIFLEVSDKVVIPTFLDNVTTKGMINLIKEVGVNRVAMIVPNRVGRSKMEREHLNKLKEKLEGVGAAITDPIYQTIKIMQLTERSKTIMETKSKQYDDIKQIFAKIVREVM